MHSPVEMVQLDDVHNTAKLIAAFTQKLYRRHVAAALMSAAADDLLLLFDIDGTLLAGATQAPRPRLTPR